MGDRGGSRGGGKGGAAAGGAGAATAKAAEGGHPGPPMWDRLETIAARYGLKLEKGNRFTNEKYGDGASVGIPALFTTEHPGAVFLNEYNTAHTSYPFAKEWAATWHAGGHTSTALPEHSLVHEIGHALHFRKDPGAFRGSIRTELTAADKAAVGRHVSKRALVNGAEFVAETFAKLYAGHKVDPGVMALYREFNGPDP